MDVLATITTESVIITGLGALLSLVVSAIGWWVNHVSKNLKEQERRFYEFRIHVEQNFARNHQVERFLDAIHQLRMEIKEDLQNLKKG